ncbi:MAG: HEAT repeat domain-containing protein [Phycisphaerales bacterium]
MIPPVIPTLVPAVGLLVCLAGFGVGCGAQIRPDGPKQVVFHDPDGSRKVIRTPISAELRQLAIDRLMEMTADPSAEIRANAIEALSPIRAQVEPIVAIALSDENPGVRTVATMVAGREHLRSLAPTIRDMIHDQSPYVRSAALYASSVFGEPVDLTEISVLLLEDPSPHVRSQAAFILGELGDPSAIPLLQQASMSRMPQATPIELKLFRLQIAESMIKLGSDRGIDVVRAALYPSRAEELEATALAVQIIGEVKDEGSVDQLIYLSDPNADIPMPAEVRLGVAGALAAMGHREGAFVADEYVGSEIDAVRAQVASLYGRTTARGNLGKLELMMLNDPSPIVQVAAAGAIVNYTQREIARKSS